jgi:hypothetical protein
MGLMLALSPEMVECGARRYLAIEDRRFTASRGNSWHTESFADFEDCLKRLRQSAKDSFCQPTASGSRCNRSLTSKP